MAKANKVIVVFGPTGEGKSSTCNCFECNKTAVVSPKGSIDS